MQLGDSVASGEGTLYGYRYDRATQQWTGGNVDVTWPPPYPDCHDSPDAYGAVTARRIRARFNQFACTGATFLNGITTPQTTQGLLSSTTLRPAQFGDWDSRTDLNSAYSSARADVVLVTFGADDADFTDIVRDCVLNAFAYTSGLTQLACTADNPGPTVTSAFLDLVEQGTLAEHYRELARWIRRTWRAASPSRVPAVVFTTYPDPLPPGGAQCPDSNYLHPEQLVYLSSLVDRLNDEILTTVDAIDHPRVIVANVEDVYASHTWCTEDPWAYGLSIYTVSDLTSLESQAPFHPTPRGQRADRGGGRADRRRAARSVTRHGFDGSHARGDR